MEQFYIVSKRMSRRREFIKNNSIMIITKLAFSLFRIIEAFFKEILYPLLVSSHLLSTDLAAYTIMYFLMLIYVCL